MKFIIRRIVGSVDQRVPLTGSRKVADLAEPAGTADRSGKGTGKGRRPVLRIIDVGAWCCQGLFGNTKKKAERKPGRAVSLHRIPLKKADGRAGTSGTTQ